MTIRDAKGEIIDKIPIQKILVSVSDKSGLETLIPGLLAINPTIEVMSTGGTYKTLKEIMSKQPENLMEVSEYTGFPEMEGGLVKTLHPKIHAGILGERNNPAHQDYLAGMHGDYIDMVIVNLYPFQQTIAKPDTTFEKARGNIDIGGPTMMRAAAKNFLSCASVCDPKDYEMILGSAQENQGSTTFDQRAMLAAKVFKMTSEYDTAIAQWAAKQTVEQVRAPYTFAQR